MGGLDSQKSYERTDSSPEVKAECSVQRQTLGNTLADDMCNPEAPKQPEKTERQIVSENFDKMKVEFEALGIEFNRDFYKAAYYGLVTKDKRPPIELVYGRMNIFFMKAKESNLAKTILHSRSKDLHEILQFHLLGKDAEASEHEIELFSNIDAKILINSLETTIGIKFNDKQAKQLLSQLSGNGINPKEANRYIGEIKNLSPDNFKLLKGSKDLLIQNLLALILTLSKAGSKAKDLVKSQLEVRAKFTQEFIANKKLADKNKTVVKKFGQRIANYKKEHPGVELDETLAKYEAKMVDAAHNVAYYEMLQALTTTKSDLALTYLNKSGKDTKYSKAKGVIADIFQSKNSSDIKRLSAKYDIELTPTLSSLQTAESNFETKSVDEYIARETGNNSYARDAYDKFYKTGKVEGADKKAILSRLEFESDKLIDSSNKLVSRINSESIFFDQLAEKYKNISEVPTKERRAAILKSEGYLQLLNQHAGIQARLLSIAATYDTLGVRPEKTAGDTEKKSWENVVGDMRQEATESLEKSKSVAQFLQIKGYESPDLNQASLSRLTLTLIQKENAGLEEKYKGTMDNVTNNYENLGDVMNQFSKAQSDPNWAEENGTKLIRIFNQGTESYDKIIPSINVTRGKFENMKKDLYAKLIEVGKGDSALLRLHPQLKAVYETILVNAIKNVDTILNDDNSPVSLRQREKLKLAQEEFGKKKQDFLDGTIKDIAVFSVIMATSVGGGLIGARIISALVKISSNFLVPAELIAEGTAGARIVSGVSTLLVPAGMSAGGVIGSRAGMELTNKVGWSQFKSEDIWDPAKMRKDFYWGYGLSLGTVLAASVITRGLKAASVSGIASENPAVLNLSQRAAQSVAKSAPSVLDKLGKAKKIFSPLEIETKNSKALLTKFGAQFIEETAEETAEEVSERIHPVLGFLASIVNASNGTGAHLNIAGVDTNKVGLNVQGNYVTYNAKSPAEFVSNLKAYFDGKKDSSFDTKINPDGSVEISIYGKTLHQSIATMTIHPAIETALPQAVKALNLAEQIKDPTVKKTAMEIANELLGGAIAKSKEAFMKTAAKFKSISASLQSNAKELVAIFHEKFMQQGGSFGMNGAQILQAIYETGVQFLGGKADVNLSPFSKETAIQGREQVTAAAKKFSDVSGGTIIKLFTKNSPIGDIIMLPSGKLILRNFQRTKHVEIPVGEDFEVGVNSMEAGFFGESEPKISGSRLIIFPYISRVDGKLNIVVRDKGSKNGTYAQLAKGEQQGENRPPEALDPLKQPLKGSKDIIAEAREKSPRQFNLTERILRSGLFKIEKTINIDGKKFHIGPVLRLGGDDDHNFAIMMVDRGDGRLYPRLLYQSGTGGEWMCTRGVRESDEWIAKGLLTLIDRRQRDQYGYAERDSYGNPIDVPDGKERKIDAAYTETQVTDDIADYLEGQKKAGNIKVANRPFDIDFFGLSTSDLQETNTYSPMVEARKEGRDETNLGTEVYPAPESGQLVGAFGIPQYMPGHLDELGSENAAGYFRNLDNSYPKGFIPDFRAGPVAPAKSQNHPLLGTIMSETYRGQLNGRPVNWTICYETSQSKYNTGKVWIANIRMADSPITTYGTYGNYLFTGILGHKPLDYKKQTSSLALGVDKKSFNERYDDITPLLDNLLPIRQFRQARGIYRP